jgi:hypothetical protein
MKKSLLHLLNIALMMSLTACSGCHRKKSGSPMDGHLSAGLYTNSFFGFTVTVPTNWIVLNRTDIETAPSRPAPPPKQVRNPMTGQMIDLPDMDTYDLITLVQSTNLFPDVTLTALGTTNCAFSVLGQYVTPFEEIHTGKDYLGMLVGVFAILQAPNQEFRSAGPSEVPVGGRKFYRDTFRRNMKTVQVSQRIYARVEAGYALIFVLTAPTESELDKLEQIMTTAQFH